MSLQLQEVLQRGNQRRQRATHHSYKYSIQNQTEKGKLPSADILSEPSLLHSMVLLLLLLLLLLSLLSIATSFRHISWRVSKPYTPLRLLSTAQSSPSLGTVSLVGAGPGDPNLLTIQAMKLLQNASLVISDRLVSQEILSLITCELKIAKKRPGCAEEAQREIYSWMKEAVLEGKNVVRLKIGDPFLFGRGGEEVLEMRKLGIECQVSPGVSSSYSAPLAAMIPLTHRGVSSHVVISTGYGQDAAVIDVPAYKADTTVVLLMAVGRIGEIAFKMVSKGFPSSTPVAIIEKATTPQQRILYGTLADIGAVAKEHSAVAPATIVVGDVVNVLSSSS